jgi:hypothetical protein
MIELDDSRCPVSRAFEVLSLQVYHNKQFTNLIFIILPLLY